MGIEVSTDGVIQVFFGFKLCKAVALVAVWRSFFLEGLQDQSTSTSLGVTG